MGPILENCSQKVWKILILNTENETLKFFNFEKNWKLKKTGNCDYKIFQNKSKKIWDPFWKFSAKSFQTLKKQENFILYGKISKIIMEKVTKKYGIWKQYINK